MLSCDKRQKFQFPLLVSTPPTWTSQEELPSCQPRKGHLNFFWQNKKETKKEERCWDTDTLYSGDKSRAGTNSGAKSQRCIHEQWPAGTLTLAQSIAFHVRVSQWRKLMRVQASLSHLLETWRSLKLTKLFFSTPPPLRAQPFLSVVYNSHPLKNSWFVFLQDSLFKIDLEKKKQFPIEKALRQWKFWCTENKI